MQILFTGLEWSEWADLLIGEPGLEGGLVDSGWLVLVAFDALPGEEIKY